MKRLFLFIIGLVFLFIPVFEIKLLCFLTAFTLAISKIQRIPKPHVFLILFVIYSFAYIYSPYWNIFPDNIHKILALTVLSVLGLLWSWFVSGELVVKRKIRDYYHLFFLTLVLYLINFKPLTADIAWRGDEDLHIEYIIDLFSLVSSIVNRFLPIIKNPYIIIFILSAILLYFFTNRILSTHIQRYRKIIDKIGLLGILVIIPISGFILFQHSFTMGNFIDFTLLRYPFLEKWMSFLFIAPVKFADIKLFRMIPFLSAVLIAWYLYLRFVEKNINKIISSILALTLVTIPIVYFYSSVLYLEMPILLLLTICIFDVKNLLFLQYKELIKRPSWYCLLTISFLKETVIILLGVFIILRIITQIFKQRKKLVFRQIIIETLICLSMIFPYAVYFIFRAIFSHHRDFGGDISTLLDLSNYRITLESFYSQFGLLFPLGILGGYALLFKREYVRFICLCIFICSIVIFFMYDSGIFIGYSRWNIFLYPLFLYLGYTVLILFSEKLLIIVITVFIISNIFLSPIGPDGVRKPNWGSPLIDTAEYTYPYEKAIIFLKENKTDKLLISGDYYPYRGLKYYFGKYHYQPRVVYFPFGYGYVRFESVTEYQKLDDFFTKLENNLLEPDYLQSETILYHSVNNLSLNENKTYAGYYKIIKKVGNYYHSLYIFKKTK